MTEAGWTHGKDLSAEEQSFMASVKVLIDAIEQEAYQQGRVACLGDVKRYVERQIKIGEDFIGGPDPNIQRRVALDEVIEYCDRQLAQQAQDEKGVGDVLK